MTQPDDLAWMRLALELASRGAGGAEPNPMVGCVLTKHGEMIGSGYHSRFGGPHAEVAALQSLSDRTAAAGCTVYVTLEPCCHQGKTPPCTAGLIEAGVSRVVAAMSDPFPEVAGRGVARLRQAGIEVEVGLLEAEARELNAPYLKKLSTGLPWVIGKWAMTLDGKVATSTGASQWISGTESRADAHQVRGRVDAILVGIGTALADDPLLTARPSGPRTPRRLVFDSRGRLPTAGKLAKSLDEAPLEIISKESLDPAREAELRDCGIGVWKIPGAPSEQLEPVLRRLGAEGVTNLLVEGGPGLLGQFAAAGLLDELQIYLAPKLIGGASAPGPVGDPGWTALAACPLFRIVQQVPLGPDLKLVYRR